MKKRNLFITICLIFAWLVTPLAAVADSHEPAGNISDVWYIVPKEGMNDEFEAAFKEHIAYRAKKGDPRDWQTYAPAVGSYLNYYIVRYCCTTWAERDAYDKWNAESKAGEHFNENVDQYVHKYKHYLGEVDFENSSWPEEDSGYKYFGVTRWDPKPGMGRTITETKNKMSQMAKEHGWPFHWSWSWRVGGEGGLSLVSPYKSWADMADPEQSFYEFLSDKMESEEEAGALLNSFSTSFEGSTYTIYRHIEDMSMSSED